MILRHRPIPEESPRPLLRVLVKRNGGYVLVRTRDVDWWQSEGNYVRLHLGRETYRIRGRMEELEKRLSGDLFVRIHRSTIVNVERIHEVQPGLRGDSVVRLLDGTELRLSRAYRRVLLKQCSLAL